MVRSRKGRIGRDGRARPSPAGSPGAPAAPRPSPAGPPPVRPAVRAGPRGGRAGGRPRVVAAGAPAPLGAGRRPGQPVLRRRRAEHGPLVAQLLLRGARARRAVSVDKPPIDLWLQVASTKLIGFNTTALLLPEALGGIAAVGPPLRDDPPIFGRPAAVLGGLALAVLPISVVTSRSDTMDSVMMALLVAALWARSTPCAPGASAGSLGGAALSAWPSTSSSPRPSSPSRRSR